MLNSSRPTPEITITGAIEAVRIWTTETVGMDPLISTLAAHISNARPSNSLCSTGIEQPDISTRAMASRTAAGDAPNRVPSGTPEVARRPRANRFEHPETDCFVKPTVPRTRGCIFRGVSTDFLHDPAHRTACNQTTVGRPNLS